MADDVLVTGMVTTGSLPLRFIERHFQKIVALGAPECELEKKTDDHDQNRKRDPPLSQKTPPSLVREKVVILVDHEWGARLSESEGNLPIVGSPNHRVREDRKARHQNDSAFVEGDCFEITFGSRSRSRG